MAKTEHATTTIAPNATATEVADESFSKFDGAGAVSAGAGAKTSAAQNDSAAPEFKLQQVFAKSVNSVEAAVDKAEQVSGEPIDNPANAPPVLVFVVTASGSLR